MVLADFDKVHNSAEMRTAELIEIGTLHVRNPDNQIRTDNVHMNI